jgi:dUTP pyrophosphatase
MDIGFKKIDTDAKIPTYATEGSAGFDLYAVEDTVIEPGETKMVHTGLILETPPDTAIMLYPRSGVSAKTPLRLANGVGVIDSDYRGEIILPFYNMSAPTVHKVFQYINIKGEKEDDYTYSCLPDRTVVIKKGDRIAQGIIHDVSVARFVPVKEVSETKRGKGGFGSTGTK